MKPVTGNTNRTTWKMNQLIMLTKSFFPFYQGNKANTAPIEALCLPIAQRQQPPQPLLQTAGCREGSKALPIAFKSALFQHLPFSVPRVGSNMLAFFEVISTFWEKQHFFMGFAGQRIILPSPFLVFFVVWGFFSPFFFLFALWSCVWNSTWQRGTWRGQEGGMQHLNGTHVPFHSSAS